MNKPYDLTFVSYELPTSMDGKYICLLDNGQILRSRREQLGLSVQQVAEMAGLQFSQYQRLESGDRFFSGCSMRVGLSICAVLLLNPYDFFCVDVQQPDPATLKPHKPFDADISDSLQKVGRKPIRRDVMTVYVDFSSLSFILPSDVLIALGNSEYIQIQWDTSEKRLLFQAVEADPNETYDAPPAYINNDGSALLPISEFPENIREGLEWDDHIYAVECRAVEDAIGHRCMLCDLNTLKAVSRLD